MVKVDNLVKNYGSFRLDVSMEIPDGTVTGIVGKNGAGKSTTIKSILGLVKPDGGLVTINGKEASKLTAKDKEEIGVALSDSGFSTFLTVKDITVIMKKMYPSFNEEVFKKNCSSQRLPFDKAIKEFSTGMRAKLRVLIAMSHNARILIMDEPTAGLDVEARNDILDLLREYLVEDEKRSILITSHISSDLEGLCDDIYLIHDGKVILHEDTDAILGNYGVLKVNEATYEKLDKSYILSTKKDHFGYACFTNEKQFYAENNPNIVIENSDIDDLILMMTGGN
ncbi:MULTISPECIES: ABC transporter ATP-binding protein [unclassified Butyrivibrio]|uniref:ABC transporter ATP-binding protein n=1 Tax=unclassified Butyrivibrio TaxID=2639466 RepID=UPI0003B673F0|nr:MULTISPECIES: ABC transporter ATP-binding protein [unclassified Butyrivibrio]